MTDYTPTGIVTIAEPVISSFVGVGYTMGPGLDYSAGMASPGFTINTVINNTRTRPLTGLAWPLRA